MNQSESVCIARYTSALQAAIDSGMLRANGIRVEERNVVVASVLPLTDTWAPIELYVERAQAPMAIKLLEANNDITDI